MSSERKEILDLLASGKITAEEAEKLLEAMGQSPVEAPATTKSKPKWFCIRVREKGEDKVNIRIPLLLLKAGIKLKGVLPDSVKGKVKLSFNEGEKGLNFDEMSKAEMEEMLAALMLAPLEIDTDDGTEVRIFCE